MSIKIGYYGDGPWAHLALDLLDKDQRFIIVYIVVRYETKDPVLIDYAKRKGIPFYAVPNVNEPEFIDRVKGHGADLNISMSLNQIVKEDIINVAPKGFVNCHAGALPFYRGRNILNWALINDEDEFGVTVHYIDVGIDTGDIILQKFVSITDNDDYRSLLDRSINCCAETLHEAVILICEDNVTVKKQQSVHSVGTYCGIRKKGDEYIDWDWPSRRIFNFVRAISFPGPYARTFFQNREIAIIIAKEILDAPVYIGTEGEVVNRTPLGCVVKTGDKTILIIEVGDIVDGEVTNIRKANFRMGTRFKNRIEQQLHEMQATIIEMQAKGQ